MDAILESEDVSYKFPSTVKELDDDAQGFESLTTQAAIKGCVACMVGYLLQIKVPSSIETGNVKAYFSGHYQTYGINVQADLITKVGLFMLLLLHLEEQMT